MCFSVQRVWYLFAYTFTDTYFLYTQINFPNKLGNYIFLKCPYTFNLFKNQIFGIKVIFWHVFVVLRALVTTNN